MLIKQPDLKPHENNGLFFEVDLKKPEMDNKPIRRAVWRSPTFIAATVLFILTMIILLLPYLHIQDLIANSELQGLVGCDAAYDPAGSFSPGCRGSLVESIPVGLTYDNNSVSFPSTFETWYDMIERANSTIDIASFYWSLRNDDVISEPHPSSKLGEMIFQSIIRKGQQKNVKIRIAQNLPNSKSSNYDTDFLKEQNLAEVRHLDFSKLVGAGILHTKFIIVDRREFYLGSANMDWRSLTQVKELGIAVRNCPCFAEDLRKIFEVYWTLGEENAVVPPEWPRSLATIYNKDTPYQFNLNGDLYPAYLSSSPPIFCPEGRTWDVEAVIDVIRGAKRHIYIAVMDYLPLFAYSRDAKFWPVIDDALRTAALKRVEVRLLISHWNHTRSEIKYFLKSLVDLTGIKKNVVIKARFFQVPSTDEEKRIPFSRVNHNKYMVTDNAVFIGTSNWSADYFVNTGGVSLIAKQKPDDDRSGSLRDQLESVFLRDWESEYAYDIDTVNGAA
nr:PREDICTED: phospholipase D3-like [Bemisia tabaci]